LGPLWILGLSPGRRLALVSYSRLPDLDPAPTRTTPLPAIHSDSPSPATVAVELSTFAAGSVTAVGAVAVELKATVKIRFQLFLPDMV